jgi:hypothetical protein
MAPRGRRVTGTTLLLPVPPMEERVARVSSALSAAPG